jgi:hypothetical protein
VHNPLSPRHALTAIIFSYHAYDWVFEQIWFEKKSGTRTKVYGISQTTYSNHARERAKKQFRNWLIDPGNPDGCTDLKLAGDVTNGTKHSVVIRGEEVSVWSPEFSRDFGPRWTGDEDFGFLGQFPD